ncbi:PAS domain-containing protein [Thioalbus denitrificans]|uniref:histidine kinase n=1 Tax=Thioalbus denitrificans TaxID=547122 RepID=A0A369CC72_9GAMM|nr:PAS domain-containing protein [Thioalbus denitrificans]RCX30217.1 two-component system sensor kinase FixL [Thioalbus denitrificans]
MTHAALISALAAGLAAGGGAAWLGLRRQARRRGARGDDLLFRTLFEAAPECVKLQSREGIVERMNAAGLALLEASRPGRIVGRSVYGVIAPEHHAAYRALTEAVFRGEPGTMEFELLTFRGRRRWLETHAVPLRAAPGGAVTGLLAITRDITERKWMTRQLEEQRNRLRTIIESEPECVKLHDRQGVILEINPAGRALLDAVSSGQVVGRTVYDFLVPDYHAAYRALTRRVFAGERATLAFEVTGLGGRRRWLETHATPLRDGEGHIDALLAITRDIDQRKRAEAKLRQQQAELAHVCRLSTLSELASGLAHELSQPLCAISSYAESAAALPGADGEVRNLLERVVEQSGRAATIIGRLRDFVRKRAPRPAATPPQVIVDNVLHFTAAELRHHGVILHSSVTPDLPPVRADRVQIEQVLINLITNAIQALARVPAGERRINLEAALEDGATIAFQVCDNGCGISPQHCTRLFTPFFTTRSGGLGLGLSISRTIVEDHGGRIACTVEDGETRFRFTLPVAGP